MTSFAQILEAEATLRPVLRRTPLELSGLLSELAGRPVYLKLECLQITGSFKVRGAYVYLSRLSAAERARGVVTCSAGNHGKGVAWAGRELSVPVRVHVPLSVDQAKLAGMKRLGAEVIVSAVDGYDETEAIAEADAEARGLPFISAYEDDAIRAGNGGTLGLELLDQLPELASVATPLSGGGLAAGMAVALDARRPGVELWACQHEGSASLAVSLARGEAATSLPPIQTLAGGLEGGIGAVNFAMLADRVRGVATVSEQALKRAVVWALDAHQLLIEPSGAAALAAILEGKIPRAPGPLVVILTGRNLALGTLSNILDEPRA